MTTPDPDRLPPTQYLILDVLAARYRLGEPYWSFPTSVRWALLGLQDAGLVEILGTAAPRAFRVRLTAAGKKLVVTDTYSPPNGGYARLRRALEGIAEFAEQREDITIGMTAVKNTARQALKEGPCDG